MSVKFKKILLVIMWFLSVSVLTISSVAGAPAEKVQVLQGEVIAYYFHGTYRCLKCKKIEQFSREAVHKYFADRLEDGSLTYKALNTDQPENRHFLQDYQLYTKSLVIVLMKDGKQVKWKNLEKVWQYLNDRETFFKYVQAEIEKFLEET